MSGTIAEEFFESGDSEKPAFLTSLSLPRETSTCCLRPSSLIFVNELTKSHYIQVWRHFQHFQLLISFFQKSPIDFSTLRTHWAVRFRRILAFKMSVSAVLIDFQETTKSRLVHQKCTDHEFQDIKSKSDMIVFSFSRFSSWCIVCSMQEGPETFLVWIRVTWKSMYMI